MRVSSVDSLLTNNNITIDEQIKFCNSKNSSQEGFSDDRGQIIFQLSRIMREMQPKCFILENVKGLVTHDGGRTIKKIMEELNILL